jgi:cytochrome c5
MKRLSLALALWASVVLVACGEKKADAPAPATAPVAATVSAASAAAPAAAENAAGKAVFNKTCAMCHAAGVAGAPKPGDKADWAPRIAQGNDVLYKHALEGFTGSKGQMPARGGMGSLSDADVKAGVDYMVGVSK